MITENNLATLETVLNADVCSKIMKGIEKKSVLNVAVPKQVACMNNDLCYFKDRNCTYETGVRCFSSWDIRKTCRFWYNNYKKRVN